MAKPAQNTIYDLIVRSIRKFTLTGAIGFLSIFVIAILGITIISHRSTLKLVDKINRDWAFRQAGELEKSLSERLSDIESNLILIAGIADTWEIPLRAEAKKGFKRSGKKLFWQGNRENGDIVVFGSALRSRGARESTGSEAFDRYAKIIMATDPAINGVAYYKLSGLIRRYPANGFYETFQDFDELPRSEFQRIAARTQQGSAALVPGCKFIKEAMLAPYSIIAPVGRRNNFKAILICEFDMVDFLEELNLPTGAWVFLSDNDGILLAGNAKARELFGVHSTDLSKLRESSLRDVGSFIMRRTRGKQSFIIDGTPTIVSTSVLPEMNLKFSIGFPVEKQNKLVNTQYLTLLAIFVLVSLVFLVLMILLARYLNNRGENYADQFSLFISNLRHYIIDIQNEDSSFPIDTDDYEELIGLYYTIRDTKLKIHHAQSDLNERNVLFSSALYELGIAVVVLDRRLFIRHLNNRAREIRFGAEIDHEANWLLHDPEYLGGALASEVISKNITRMTEIDLVVDGKPHKYKITYLPLVDSKGEVIGCGEIYLDISSETELREQLEKIQSELSGAEEKIVEPITSHPVSFETVANELIPLLESICGSLRLVKEMTKNLDAALIQDLDKADKHALRLLDFANEIKDYDLHSRGILVLHPRQLPVLSLLTSLENYVKWLPNNSTTLQFLRDEGNFIINVDPMRYRQLLRLLLEVIVAHSATETVEIRYSREGEKVLFAFTLSQPVYSILHDLYQRSESIRFTAGESHAHSMLKMILIRFYVDLLDGSLELESIGNSQTITLSIPSNQGVENVD